MTEEKIFSRWIEEPCSIVFVPWTKDKGQCTKHIWFEKRLVVLNRPKERGGKNLVVVQANIYLGKTRWAQNLPSNKWKSDVTKCKCKKCCSVPKYILWDDISFQYNFSHSSQWTIFLPLCHSDHCPLGRQWKSSELLHSTPSASLTLTWLWLYFKTIFSIFISGSLQSFGKLSLFLHYY